MFTGAIFKAPVDRNSQKLIQSDVIRIDQGYFSRVLNAIKSRRVEAIQGIIMGENVRVSLRQDVDQLQVFHDIQDEWVFARPVNLYDLKFDGCNARVRHFECICPRVVQAEDQIGLHFAVVHLFAVRPLVVDPELVDLRVFVAKEFKDAEH